jgi:hypothetical protein
VVVVTGSDPTWVPIAFDCADNSDLTPDQASVLGPQRTPYGSGSRQMQIGQFAEQTEIYRTPAYDGTPLADISRLEYSTYARQSDGAGPDRQAPYLRLTLDSNADGVRNGADDSLFFYPSNNADQHAIVNGEWQNWDVANGVVNVNGDDGPQGAMTIQAYATSHPGATLINNNGGDPTGGSIATIVGCAGGGNDDTYRNGTYNVDRVIVGDNGQDTLFDFENGANETSDPSAQQTIDPNNMGPWAQSAFDPTQDPGDLVSNQQFVRGPGNPPLGVGSLKFTMNDNVNPNRVEQFRTDKYDGRLLRDLRGLSYWTYQHPTGSNTSPQQPVYVRINVSTDGDNTMDEQLYFSPANNGDQAAVLQNTWQRWAVFSGRFTVGGDQGPDAASTLESYLVQHPDARIVNNRVSGGTAESGGLDFQVGAAGDNQRNGEYFLDDINVRFVDAASSTNVSGTEYDLEPTIPSPGISISNARMKEGNVSMQNMTFTVKLDKPTYKDVTLAYTTKDGTAKAGEDYIAQSGMVTIPADSTSTQITVPINGDKKYEPNERFRVVLSDPSLGSLTDATGVGTIVNDDTRVDLALTNGRGTQIRATVYTTPPAPGSAVTFYRDQRGTDPVLGSATLDANGHTSVLLEQSFRKGATVKAYAKVEVGSEGYRSPTQTITVS